MTTQSQAISDSHMDAERPSVTGSSTGKHLGKRATLLLGGLLALAAGAAYYVHLQQFEATDNAQVDGDITSLSPRVPGIVAAVHVTENQRVRAGDLLAELDQRELQIARDAARANVELASAELAEQGPLTRIAKTSSGASVAHAASSLAAARAGHAAAERQLARARAELARADAQSRQAKLELERSRVLLSDGSVALAEFEALENAARAAAANVAACEEQIGEALQRVAQQSAAIHASLTRHQEATLNAPSQIEASHASLQAKEASLAAASAALAQAELNLSYAKIVAPVNGIVARKAVVHGDRVAPGQALFAIAQVDNLWVTANFRETQLARVAPGQQVEIYVDALGTSLRGSVDSVGGSTGARLSIFPPENAAGNYVKVVQRIPVRIRFEADQPGMDRLRPGMSVEPEVRL